MKIGIVGAGQVGATAAYSMMMRRVGSEIMLVDRNADLAVAQARDILDATKDFLLGLRRRGLNRVEFVVAALHCEDRRAPALDANDLPPWEIVYQPSRRWLGAGCAGR